jgi:hypothetical protein
MRLNRRTTDPEQEEADDKYDKRHLSLTERESLLLAYRLA